MGELFEPSVRPDLGVMSDSTVSVLELTVCHETNLLKSRQYKLDKYSHLGQKLVNSHSSKTLEYFTLEVSTLGFMSDINEFLISANLPNLPQGIAMGVDRRVDRGTNPPYFLELGGQSMLCPPYFLNGICVSFCGCVFAIFVIIVTLQKL